jgi:hypothetical protein
MDAPRLLHSRRERNLSTRRTRHTSTELDKPRRTLTTRHCYVDGFATLDTSDRQGRIAGYEEAVGVMLFRTMT